MPETFQKLVQSHMERRGIVSQNQLAIVTGKGLSDLDPVFSDKVPAADVIDSLATTLDLPSESVESAIEETLRILRKEYEKESSGFDGPVPVKQKPRPPSFGRG